MKNIDEEIYFMIVLEKIKRVKVFFLLNIYNFDIKKSK